MLSRLFAPTLACALAALLWAAAPAAAGVGRWTPLGPYTSPVSALAVDPKAPGTVYAGVTPHGIVKSTDGGATWAPANRGTDFSPPDVLAVDPGRRSIVYAGGAFKGVLKSTDRGAFWKSASAGLPSGDRTFVYALAPDPRGTGLLYAGTAAGVFRSADRAGSWQAAKTGLPAGIVRALLLDPARPDTVVAGVTGGVFKSVDRGATWTGGPLPGVHAVFALAADPRPAGALFAGTDAGLFRSDDRGASWQADGTIAGIPVKALAASPAGTLYVGTDGAGVFRSTDGGATWVAASLGLTDLQITELAVDPAQEGTVYVGTAAVRAPGGVFKSVDRGEHWAVRNVGFGNVELFVVTVDPRNPDVLYLGTDVLGVLKSTDRGLHWTGVNQGIFDASPPLGIVDIKIDPTDSSIVYAVGGANGIGIVFKSVNAGASWVRLGDTASQENQIIGLAIDPQHPNILYGGGLQGLYKSTDGGVTWVPLQGPVSQAWILDIAIDPITPSTVYASGMYFPGEADRQPGVFKSTDGGATWTQLRQGLPSNTSDDTARTIAIDPAHPGTLYAGFQIGLYKSTDSGATWHLTTGLLGPVNVRSVVFLPSSPDTLYFATQEGDVFRSTDGGVTWTELDTGLAVQYGMDLAIDPTGPGRLYLATLTEGLFTFEEPVSGPCVSGPATLCLQGGRFRVEVGWEDLRGSRGAGQALPMSDASGSFWFFERENVELTVKIVDARPQNGHFWVFYGSLTTVEFTVTVTDTTTGEAREYRKPAGALTSGGDATSF
jgi:photosystem II stability/assembly factor-like uncharacterized protein